MLLIIAGVAILIVLGYTLHYCMEKKKVYTDLKNKHVVITGGSSGIGKAAAEEAARLGAHVTVIGRDINRLKTAVADITAQCLVKEEQKIQYCVLDVTASYETIQKALAALEADVAPIFMLINSAGQCICGQFEQMNPDDIKKMIDLNYFGTAYATKYVLTGMKERDEGIIVFVSTEAALLGIYGYSAYSGAKWAVRGLAESLFMELVGTGVRVTLAFPPDTDTPGFKTEELTKPKETKLISGSGGLQSPESVGKAMVHDALQGKCYSTFGLSGKMMSTLYCGGLESISQILIQMLTMGFLRAIMVGVLLSFHKIVRDGLKERKTEAQKTK